MQLLVKPTKLSPEQVEDVERLYRGCNEHDKSRYAFDNSDEFKRAEEVNTFLLYEGRTLAASMNIFAPTKKEAEIIGLTLPECRRQGHFTKLLGEVRKELDGRGIPSILFVCDGGSRDGNGVVQHLQAEYEYSEYLMRCIEPRGRPPGDNRESKKSIELIPAQQVDIPRLKQISTEAFDREERESESILEEFFSSTGRDLYRISYKGGTVGMIGIHAEGQRHYIHGFCIDPAFQGRGIGRYALVQAVNLCLEKDGEREIELEVQVANTQALCLYESAGFSVLTEFRYYRSTPTQAVLE
ncbi:MAG: GNAT family N-acetyltransferase [Spirochaetaceae bacterium]|nr:GNAT family N-acetyltransferase [Spirochaetaceae bacterium]MCF7949682.1 GNAT family N-acetyltransferase [Spirochaetia bacterium]MCF7950929.1 GNAT family N-acetyltransferase [Spirochaetaceae bacterium]